MSTGPSERSGTRFHFVDLLRGWAVLFMIETHVVNALILPEHKLELPHKILTFINGLVAPTFLFCAGFAIAISFKRRWSDFTPQSGSYWRQFFRLLLILVIGYTLHLPFFSLKQLLSLSDPSVWQPFYQADILQTISVSLLLLMILAATIRRERFFFLTASLLTLVFVFAAPIVREADLTALPVWLQPYLTMKVKTQFPLFPWSAFLMGGMLIGAGFITAKERSAEQIFMKRLALLAFGAILASLVIEVLPLTIYPNHDFWKGSPEFFFVRFGLVVLFLCLLWQYDRQRQAGGKSLLALFGQESLIVYVVHLLIVYGHTYEFSLIRMYGPTLNYTQTFGLFALLTGAMYVLAYAWHAIKLRDKRIARYIQFAVLTGIVISFVLK